MDVRISRAEALETPLLRHLEAACPAIRREAAGLPPSAYFDWPERRAYRGTWRVAPLIARRRTITLAAACPASARACPATVALLERVPGLVRAGLSLLLPGSHVLPHEDGGDELRCHLTLETNARAGLRIAGRTIPHRAGRCLLFDGRTTTHEAANLGDTPRVVLVLGLRWTSIAGGRTARSHHHHHHHHHHHAHDHAHGR